MASFLAFFLLLSSILQSSQASPAKLHISDDAAVALSSASTIVVTATTGDFPVVTFYPSRVTDTSLWTLIAPTTISGTELLGPQGYIWAAPTSLSFEPPEIPSGAPYPLPPNPSLPVSAPGIPTVIPTEPTEYIPSPPPESTYAPPGETAQNSTLLTSEPTLGYPPSSRSGSHRTGAHISLSGRPKLPKYTTTKLTATNPTQTTDATDTATTDPTAIKPTQTTNATNTATADPIAIKPTQTTDATDTATADPIASKPTQTTDATDTAATDVAAIKPTQTADAADTAATDVAAIKPTQTADAADTAAADPIAIKPTTTTTTSSGSTRTTDPENPTKDRAGATTDSNDSRAPHSGTWRERPTDPTREFPPYKAPTTTIPESKVTSEAKEVSNRFMAIYVNRDQITNPKQKDEYIENIEKTRDETLSLLNSLVVKPDLKNPACSSTKRKRSLISGITSLVGDVAGLISCATQVLDNLVDNAMMPVPPIPVIETLTNTLSYIGEQLDDSTNDNNPTESTPETEVLSSTAEGSTTIATCTSGTAVPRCTETVSLSTSGTAVETITTMECTTVTDCGATATTASTTETATSTFVCSPECEACTGLAKRDKVLEPRDDEPLTVEPIGMYDGADDYVTWHVQGNEPQQLEHKMRGSGSSALSAKWAESGDQAFLYVNGLVGCTSVIIVSEAGVWFSHHWEVPAFKGADIVFNEMVIDPIKNGDPNTGMEGAFPLGAEGNILHKDNNVQIFISTPKDPNTGELLFASRVSDLVDLLTGSGAPWEGITPKTRGYLKPIGDQEAEAFAKLANSKVLIEYAKNYPTTDEYGEPIEGAGGGPIYRVWLERDANEHKWGTSCSNTGNQRRQDGDPCNSTSGSSQTLDPTTTDPTTTDPTTTDPITTDPTTIDPTTTDPTDTATTTDAKYPSIQCYPFQKPAQGPDAEGCHCEGFTEDFPFIPTASRINDDLCGYTTIPTQVITSVTPFTTTEVNGEVVSCASSTYYNYIVNHDAECAGATKVVSTVESIASVYAKSTSAAAEASWTSAAAVPSAGCRIIDESGWGDSLFFIYGINGWAGENGGSLHDEEGGCGIVSGWEFHDDSTDEFEGRSRDTQWAVFGLSFFKGGCVERAIHSAGGPEPGDDDGQVSCQYGPVVEYIEAPLPVMDPIA